MGFGISSGRDFAVDQASHWCKNPSRHDPKIMSLEYELQKFPREIKLKDGSKSRLRPLRKDDEKAFHEFFLAVPEPERMFIKHRVTDPAVIR